MQSLNFVAETLSDPELLGQSTRYIYSPGSCSCSVYRPPAIASILFYWLRVKVVQQLTCLTQAVPMVRPIRPVSCWTRPWSSWSSCIHAAVPVYFYPPTGRYHFWERHAWVYGFVRPTIRPDLLQLKTNMFYNCLQIASFSQGSKVKSAKMPYPFFGRNFTQPRVVRFTSRASKFKFGMHGTV